MAGRGQSWVLVAKFWFAVSGCGWLCVVQVKLWLVVDGRVWSFNIAYFYGKSKKLHSFLNSKCVTRERTFHLQTKIQWAWLVDWYWLVIDPWRKISDKTENSVSNGCSNKYNRTCTCQVKVCFSIFSQITTLRSLMSQFNALVLIKFTISTICTILKFLLR